LIVRLRELAKGASRFSEVFSDPSQGQDAPHSFNKSSLAPQAHAQEGQEKVTKVAAQPGQRDPYAARACQPVGSDDAGEDAPSAPLARWGVPVLFGIAAASSGLQAVDKLGQALTQPSSRALMVALYGLLQTSVAFAFAWFTVGRAAPRRPARTPVAFLACALPMAAVIAFTAPGGSAAEGVMLAGELVAVASCAWLLVSVLSLGRCFGVLPEARGLVTSGPYRFVRHPVYLGEIGACAGLAIAAPTYGNAAIFAALVIAQNVRMRLEERALTQAFPEYAEYVASTPRLLPRPRALAPARDSAGSPSA
jgi:protein-S-isoprenylcysteine O-methyltransferase Ste14